jgi:alpha-amylase
MESLKNDGPDVSNGNRLSKSVVLYLELHHTPRLLSSHPDASHQPTNTTDIVDHAATERSIQKNTNDLYEPVIEMLLKVITACPQTKIALAVSGQMLEQLSKHAARMLDTLKRLHETGKIEWLGVPYNNSLSARISQEVYREEVIRNNDMLYQYLGTRPKVLLATPLFEPSMVSLAASMGFEALLIKPGVCTGRSVVRDITNEVVILSADKALTSAISQHFGAGEATLTTDEFVEKINAASDATVVMGFSFDVFHSHRDAGILAFFEKLLSHAAKEGKLVHPSEAIHQYVELMQWRAPLTLDYSSWLGNELQRDALANAQALNEATKNRKDENIRKSWLQLLSSDYFLDMSSSDPGLSKPYLSAHEAYATYIDALHHLQKSLENAPLLEDEKLIRAVESERQHPTTPTWALQEQSKYQEATRTHL